MSRVTGTLGILGSECPGECHAIVMDHPSEHVQSWEIGWLWPWRRSAVARSLIEGGVRPGQTRQLIFRLEKSGWRATLVTLDETAVAQAGAAGVWRLSHCLPFSDAVRGWNKRVMRVVQVANGWRFAAYVGGHLVYSRHLEKRRCPDRSTADNEARALAGALSSQGIATISDIRFLEAGEVSGWCRQYVGSCWYWRGALKRPEHWPAPRQWRWRLMALWLWSLSLGGVNAALSHWGVPAPDDKSPKLVVPAVIREAGLRLKAQTQLAEQTRTGEQRWLELLADGQSAMGSPVTVQAISWRKNDGRLVMRWHGRADNEPLWQAYRRNWAAEKFEALWPQSAVDLRWQRLNSPRVQQLGDPTHPEPVQWRATLEVRL